VDLPVDPFNSLPGNVPGERPAAERRSPEGDAAQQCTRTDQQPDNTERLAAPFPDQVCYTTQAPAVGLDDGPPYQLAIA
jgi:hypothetical protein